MGQKTSSSKYKRATDSSSFPPPIEQTKKQVSPNKSLVVHPLRALLKYQASKKDCKGYAFRVVDQSQIIDNVPNLNLPTHVFCHVLKFLNIGSIVKLNELSSTWNSVMKQDNIWLILDQLLPSNIPSFMKSDGPSLLFTQFNSDVMQQLPFIQSQKDLAIAKRLYYKHLYENDQIVITLSNSHKYMMYTRVIFHGESNCGKTSFLDAIQFRCFLSDKYTKRGETVTLLASNFSDNEYDNLSLICTVSSDKYQSIAAGIRTGILVICVDLEREDVKIPTELVALSPLTIMIGLKSDKKKQSNCYAALKLCLENHIPYYEMSTKDEPEMAEHLVKNIAYLATQSSALTRCHDIIAPVRVCV